MKPYAFRYFDNKTRIFSCGTSYTGCPRFLARYCSAFSKAFANIRTCLSSLIFTLFKKLFVAMTATLPIHTAKGFHRNTVSYPFKDIILPHFENVKESLLELNERRRVLEIDVLDGTLLDLLIDDETVRQMRLFFQAVERTEADLHAARRIRHDVVRLLQ